MFLDDNEETNTGSDVETTEEATADTLNAPEGEAPATPEGEESAPSSDTTENTDE